MYTLTAFLRDHRLLIRRFAFCDESKSLTEFFSDTEQSISLYRVTFYYTIVRYKTRSRASPFLFAVYAIHKPGRHHPIADCNLTLESDGTFTFRDNDDLWTFEHSFGDSSDAPTVTIFGTEHWTNDWNNSPAWEPHEDLPERSAKRLEAFRNACQVFAIPI